jgi:23S rRNA A2030 N6-methylase RlmJ
MSQIVTDYDHSKKIGNEGDLVKAAVLARLVTVRLEQEPATPFVYAESHSGRAEYTLPENGQWKNGVGEFVAIVTAKLGIAWRDRLVEGRSNLVPYMQANLNGEIGVGSEYFGSSRMALELIKQNGTSFRFHLWDTNQLVCDDLKAAYSGLAEISVHHGDGYDGVTRLGRASFALVDPISVAQEKNRILGALSLLARNSTPFLCWTALVGAPDQPFYVDFDREARSRYSVVQVTGKEPHDHTWGCRLIIPKDFEAVAKATAAEVVAVMNWDLT